MLALMLEFQQQEYFFTTLLILNDFHGVGENNFSFLYKSIINPP